MCMSCVCQSTDWSFGRNWWLWRANKDSPRYDLPGEDIGAGDWVLTKKGGGADPIALWKVRPTRAPISIREEDPDDDDPRWEANDAWINLVNESFTVKLVMRPYDGHSLVKECMELGYDRDKDGDLSFWLFEKLAGIIDANPNGTESDGSTKEHAQIDT